MKVTIHFDPQYGYTAHIRQYGITTQAKNRDALIKNLHEAIICTLPSIVHNKKTPFQFSLEIPQEKYAL